jgi:hypothetical protein
VDGVCCNTACGSGNDDDCQACSTQAGAGQSGVCGDRLDGLTCDDGVYCNGADSCQDGSCFGHAGDPCPGPDDDGDCNETCDEAAAACTAYDGDGALCAGGVCEGGSCQTPYDNGTPCTEPTECASAYCTDGVCCSQPDCGNYVCGPGGDCRETCSSSADCQPGFACSSNGSCVDAADDEATDDAGCGCRLVGTGGAPRRTNGWGPLALGVALGCARRRRRT